MARAEWYRFDQPHQALFVVGQPQAGATAAQLAARCEQRLHLSNSHSLVVVRERGIAVVVEARADGAGQVLAAQLLADLNHPSQPVTIGVGHAQTGGLSLRRSYEEAQEAADIGRRL